MVLREGGWHISRAAHHRILCVFNQKVSLYWCEVWRGRLASLQQRPLMHKCACC